MTRFNKYFFFLLFCFSIVSVCLSAKTDRYRASWRESPSTSMVIGWDQLSGSNPVLLYGVESDVQRNGNYKNAINQFYIVDSKGMKNYYARLRNLIPNTVYRFEIQDSEGASRQMTFKTMPDTPDIPLSIIAGGDSRNNRDARRNANLLVAKLRPDFVLFAGDMTGGDSGREWRNWMDDWQVTIARDGRITPIVAARGNHEFSNRSIIEMFDVKSKGVFYGLTFGGNLLRVYTLNSLIAVGGDQAVWLGKDLSQHQDIIWKTAQYHFPTRPHTRKKKERNAQRANWANLFLRYGVQLAVECDAHVVKSTYPIIPFAGAGSDEGFIRDDERGTVYIGEGCWGAPLRRNNDDKNWTRASGSFNQVKWLFVDKNEIEIRTVKTDNANRVAYLKDYTKFEIPRGIELWQPRTGEVIRIRNRKSFTINPTQVPTPQKEEIVPNGQSTSPKKKPKKKSLMISNKALKVEEIKPAIPTEIINFIVKKEGMDVAIHWEAIHDQATTTYEIHRLKEGSGFQRIALINGRDETKNTYEIPDKDAVILYPNAIYQLKKKTRLGEEQLFQGKLLFQSKADEFQTFNRDKEGMIRVPYTLKGGGKVQFLVKNKMGVTLREDSFEQKKGNYIKSLDISTLVKGKYILHFLVNQKIRAKHLLIVD